MGWTGYPNTSYDFVSRSVTSRSCHNSRGCWMYRTTLVKLIPTIPIFRQIRSLISVCGALPSTVTRRIVTIMISAPLFKITRILQPYCMILLCCSLLLKYLYYQDLLLICTGRNPTVLLYRYCRSIARIPAYLHMSDRPAISVRVSSLYDSESNMNSFNTIPCVPLNIH